MKYILFFVLTVTVAGLACSTAKNGQTSPINQGIEGRITEVSGNRMPMKDAVPQEPRGGFNKCFDL